MEDVNCRNCGYVHLNGNCRNPESQDGFGVTRQFPVTSKAQLPPADPWDKQTGYDQLVRFQVRAIYQPVNDDWFTARLELVINSMIHPLSTSILVSRNPDHDPPSATALKMISLAKEHVQRGGCRLSDLAMVSDLVDPAEPGVYYMNALVAGRLGVAVDKDPVTGLATVRSVN